MSGVQVNTSRLVDEFLTMVKISSPSRKEGSFAAYLQHRLEELGFCVEFDDAGEKVGGDTGNIIATLKGDEGIEPIMFCCHMDTVDPCDDIKPIVESGIISTDKTTVLGGDDKGGIAAILEAMKLLKEYKVQHGTIQLVFTIGEEVGMYGSKNLDFSKIVARKAFILDAEGELGTIIIQGPAKDSLIALFEGKSSHAGLYPERGISAIQVAARAIDKMKLLRIDQETTANIGKISGGAATNIVAEQVRIVAEARSLINSKLDAQSQHMKECCESAAQEFGAHVQVDIERSYNAFKLPEDNPVVLKCIAAMRNLGITPQLLATGGGSDCNVFNAQNIAAVDLAIGMTDVHSKNETIKIADLVTAAHLVVEIIKII